MYELHFGVPMAGAVLCTLNTRHDPATISTLLRHSEAKIIFVDYQFAEIANVALDLLSKTATKKPLLVPILDSQVASTTTQAVDVVDLEYESLLAIGQPKFEIIRPNNEWDPITLNYTSGTTSSPKGVVYNHRGAYLNTLAAVLQCIGTMPVYLWTSPMFHCNGWCFTWGLAAQGGTNICLRKVSPQGIFDSISVHKVTHMGGAPTVLNMIVNAPVNQRRPLPHKVEALTGGSAPPPHVLLMSTFIMEELGFNVSHFYGLTETSGPATVCIWKPEWDSLPLEERAKIKSRQGLNHLGMEEVDIRDPVTMESVAPDGKTMGEVMFRGNTVMSGYYKDPKATLEAFNGGWFRTGDLGVKHPDGYIEVKDRSKDIIISGGENVSTIEVESVLFSHPAVLEAAVVGRPVDHWGETPCAFVKLKDGSNASAEEIIHFCRERLPHFMAPRTVAFEDLPKNATGKIEKFVLRQKAKAMGSLSSNKI
ncbi:butanoate--CoA ligase AAE1-like [Macadamia integrifolia]|uniref:butanoate--CoA ligase AAE1-like n=1 Tax=Macadamia integrifolia TaxID=60698 RepID=UPI001C52C0D8|nr:butanoate--CoA ligase AAE1-like [Macadamia integrifolia]